MPQSFSTRLEECATKLGSKVKLAEAAGISFSQLMRYMNGSSKPTMPRIIALANAASVTPAWLLSGEGQHPKKAGQISLEKDIFLQTIRMVDRVLQNSQRQVSYVRKSIFIFALCKAAEQAKDPEQEFLLSEKSLNEMLDFMNAYTDGELEELYTALEQLPYEKDPKIIQRWASLIARGHLSIYDTITGQRYFERMLDVEGAYAQEIKSILNKAEALNSKLKSFLDLGCGNGRHLKYIHQHYPQLELKGIDTADYAVQACQNLEARELLPPETVCKADMRQLPYANNRFDLIMSRYSLFCCPLTPNHKEGLDEVFSEVYRVLKPGGIFHGMTRRGQGLSFYFAYQLLDVPDIQLLAQRHKFDVIGLRLGDTNIDLHKDSADKVHSMISQYLSFQLIKPLKG